MSTPVFTAKPVIREIIEEVIDTKFAELEKRLMQTVQKTMQEESAKQIKILKDFMKTMYRDHERHEVRITNLEKTVFA